MIVVVGTGYVGLVTGACFAEMGHHVVCIDIDQRKLQLLRAGTIPFYEPGLSELVLRNQAAGRLQFTDDYSVLSQTDFCFLALPTPSTEDGSCDLSYLFSAAEEATRWISKELLFVVKSTVPVGTAEKLRSWITAELRAKDRPFTCDVVSNPEFLREGTAVADCMKPDRILIGADQVESGEKLKKIYAPFNKSRDRVLLMDTRSAELSKYAANAMLATRISFMNELAGLCEKWGAHVGSVRTALGADQRIGPQYLYPGLGYGGSCLPKDLRALKASARQVDYATPLLDSVEWINQQQRALFLEKVLAYFSYQLEGRTLAIWGLSFKPDTDDLREAPSLSLIHELHKKGAYLKVFDPVSMAKAEPLLQKYDQLLFAPDEYAAAEEADAILLITEWKQFRLVDFSKIAELMKGRAFFDGRNQYSGSELVAHGLDYFSIGNPPYLCAAR